MRGNSANDALIDGNLNEECGDDALFGSKGVRSDAGEIDVLNLASCLHTGQNVLQVVSQESTQDAWNSENV